MKIELPTTDYTDRLERLVRQASDDLWKHKQAAAMAELEKMAKLADYLTEMAVGHGASDFDGQVYNMHLCGNGCGLLTREEDNSGSFRLCSHCNTTTAINQLTNKRGNQ